jgi:predicted hydrocarbon binding protein
MIMLKDVKETAAWERNKGQFSVIEVPAIIISIETFVILQKNAEKIIGVDGASILLYEVGKKAAMQWINSFNNGWSLKDNKFIEAVHNFYAQRGWGKFSTEENQNGLVMRVENSFVVRGYGNSDVPVCHFLRGYNAGLAQVLKGNEMGAEEVKCAAKGDDCCEFVMKRIT